MIREMDRCPYCAAPIEIGEASWVVCEYCGREMEITRFTQEEKRLIEVVEDARRSSEAAAEEVRRTVEQLSVAHSHETEKAVSIARTAMEACKSALESVTRRLETSEARKLRNLYLQAEEAQRAGRFEDAERWYRQVLVYASDEAEVFWRLVLCCYGIEYVREQASGRFLPTISHMVVDSVLENADYKSAIRLARSEEIRRFYEDEARHIDVILDKYRQVAATEQPYDVFISVKQGDENGNPTHDSLIAQDLYYMLKNELGLNVFNSRYSLSSYAGFEYEPYIMSALMRAKIMIVVGTKADYMTSAWVRNEWRRFRWLKDNYDDSRRLIAYVSGMTVREIPREMGDLQAISAGGMGSAETMCGIMKSVFGDRLNKKNERDPLMERAAMYLEDGEFDQADRCCERVLDRDPRNAGAYVIKLCALCKVRREGQLAEAAQPIDDLGDYKRAMRFGDEALKQRLEDYSKAVRERLERAAKDREALAVFEKELQECENARLLTHADVQAVEAKIRDISGRMQEFIGAEPLLERCRVQRDRCHEAYARIQAEARRLRGEIEADVAAFEQTAIHTPDDARNLSAKIRMYTEEHHDFCDIEGGNALLERCSRRMAECVQLLKEMEEQEDRRRIAEQNWAQQKRVEKTIRGFERETIFSYREALEISERIRRFVEEEDQFRHLENGDALLERCGNRMKECAQTIASFRERVEREVLSFEQETVINAAGALSLNSRISSFVEEQDEFRHYDGGAELLNRCRRRMNECADLYRQLTDQAERDEQERRQRKERRKQAEKTIRDFENEIPRTADDALQLNSRVQQYIAAQERFENHENGHILLKRCENRMYECSHIYQELRSKEEERRRGEHEKQDAREMQRNVDGFINQMRQRHIALPADALNATYEIQRFIDANNSFVGVEGGESMLELCRDEMNVFARKRRELLDAANRKNEDADHGDPEPEQGIPDQPKGLSRGWLVLYALVPAIVCTLLFMLVNGSVTMALFRVFAPVFGGVISVLLGIQSHRNRRAARAILAWAAVVLWIAYAAHVIGIF